MPEPKHAAQRPRGCDVEGCHEEAARSLSDKKVEQAGLKLRPDRQGRSAHLCKAHYKEFKKKTKKDRTLERLGW